MSDETGDIEETTADTPTAGEVMEPTEAEIERLETQEEETPTQFAERLYAKWKDGFDTEDGVMHFFGDVPDEVLLRMARMDETNPLTLLEAVDSSMSIGVVPALGSLKMIMKEYTDRRLELNAEVCRAMRRGMIK